MLTIETKTNRLRLYFPESLENYPDKFEKMKYYINSYEELGFYYFGYDDFSLPSCTVYEVFNKEIVSDSICYYKPSEDDKYKLGCLYSIDKSVNNMGEFDPYYENSNIYSEWASDICK